MRIATIGSGFSGLMASAVLSRHGHDVTIYEKNVYYGGRASSFSSDGFHFDKGPSWYWMPDIFEEAMQRLGSSTGEYYELKKLDPGFRVYFGEKDYIDIPAQFDELKAVFESIEPGAADRLDRFMEEAEVKYHLGVKQMAKFPSLSILEFVRIKVLRAALQMDLFKSVAKQVRSYFKNNRIQKIMEFPVLFLGASANKIPALYTMMNFAGLKQGTYYPSGGFKNVVNGFIEAARSNGVTFVPNAEVSGFNIHNNSINEVMFANGRISACDVVVGAADYAHVEKLLPPNKRNYSEEYWAKRTMAPSSLLFFVGVNKKLETLEHHNLFFHSDFDAHISEIYEHPKWPSDPLFYVCCPSKTDDTVAPSGSENLFFLMPIAPELNDTVAIRELYFEKLIKSFERITGLHISNNIVFHRSYCIKDFVSEYHALRGNAYGLANTLNQTAILKPTIRNKRIKNLFYTGQLTVPGPGVPPALLSGELVADYILNNYKMAKSI